MPPEGLRLYSHLSFMAAPYNRKDRYYKKAKEEGFASRAAYKLLEIQKKYTLLKSGDTVLDLGAAPGAFSQVALDCVGAQGMVLGLDLEQVQPPISHPRYHFIQGDVLDPSIQEAVRSALQQKARRPVMTVLSDLSPKLTGVALRDHVRSVELSRMALAFAKMFLAPGGNLVIKIFPGEELEGFRKEMAAEFEHAKLLNLETTRKTSREVYLLGLGKK